MKQTMLPVDKLNIAEYNPRKDLKPGDSEYESLRRSIQEFGYVEPIVVNEVNNRVVGGHQRLKVMKELGFNEIEAVMVNIPDEKDEMLLNISLNKIEGEWDEDKLKGLLIEFQENDSLDPSLMGFTDDKVDEIIGFDEDDLDSDDSDEANEGIEEENVITCPKCKHAAEEAEFIH